jgi:hypothetical protein
LQNILFNIIVLYSIDIFDLSLDGDMPKNTANRI